MTVPTDVYLGAIIFPKENVEMGQLSWILAK